MIHRSRRLGAVVLSIGCMCLLAACGSSSKSSSGSSGTARDGHGAPAGFKLTSAQQSCLKKKGVTLPTGGFRGHGAGGNFGHGKPPKGKFKHGQFPKGKFKKGQFPKGGSAQFTKRMEAMKACGVTFPSRGAPGAQSSTTG